MACPMIMEEKQIINQSKVKLIMMLNIMKVSGKMDKCFMEKFNI